MRRVLRRVNEAFQNVYSMRASNAEDEPALALARAQASRVLRGLSRGCVRARPPVVCPAEAFRRSYVAALGAQLPMLNAQILEFDRRSWLGIDPMR